MKNNKNNDVTLDDLAAMVARGFDSVNTKIESVRDELKGEISSVRDELKGDILSVRNELKSEISSLREEFVLFRTVVQSEFQKLSQEVEQLNHRLDKIEKNRAEEVELLSGDILKLKAKVAALEQKVNKFKLAN